MEILWCISGAGELLKESLSVMAKLHRKHGISVFLSEAGEEVLRSYKLFRDVKASWPVEQERTASSLPAGKVALGAYDSLVVSPASANTVAKIANGIADNLITTAVSLALKTDVPVYVVPTDWMPKRVEIPETLVKGGAAVHMLPRKSDIRNIGYLREEGIKVLEEPKELLGLLG